MSLSNFFSVVSLYTALAAIQWDNLSKFFTENVNSIIYLACKHKRNYIIRSLRSIMDMYFKVMGNLVTIQLVMSWYKLKKSYFLHLQRPKCYITLGYHKIVYLNHHLCFINLFLISFWHKRINFMVCWIVTKNLKYGHNTK